MRPVTDTLLLLTIGLTRAVLRGDRIGQNGSDVLSLISARSSVAPPEHAPECRAEGVSTMTQSLTRRRWAVAVAAVGLLAASSGATALADGHPAGRRITATCCP